jgi:hypothetical protein
VSVDVLRPSVVSIGLIQRPGSYAEVHRRVRVLQGECRGEFKWHIRESCCGDDYFGVLEYFIDMCGSAGSTVS